MYEKLGNAQQELHIKSTALVYGETPSWNAASSSIFSKDFLNPYFFTELTNEEDSEALKELGKSIISCAGFVLSLGLISLPLAGNS